jgi:hypothetical protein
MHKAAARSHCPAFPVRRVVEALVVARRNDIHELTDLSESFRTSWLRAHNCDPQPARPFPALTQRFLERSNASARSETTHSSLIRPSTIWLTTMSRFSVALDTLARLLSADEHIHEVVKPPLPGFRFLSGREAIRNG